MLLLIEEKKPDPIEEWLSAPFEPTIREGRIYCRGAGDNKGQLMAQVLALRTYLDAYSELPINIQSGNLFSCLTPLSLLKR
jgi:acetylornithine deacetylase/succinyl-diaminopimelate desuccinylase-like protein